jgi:hypothetical protein
MTKFSGSKRRPLRVNLTAPIRTRQARTLTHEGGAAYARDAESDLFLLAATNMVGEDSFYERAAARDARFVALVHEVTAANPSFVAGFVPYLRASMLMRTAAIVMAAEYVAGGGAHGRPVIAGALQRADEPAEMLGYWLTMHGRNIPMPVKRGIADAVVRLYTERAALRYDGLSRQIRMADVIELTHPAPRDAGQSALFQWLLDRRHHDDALADAANLPILHAAAELDAIAVDARRAALRERGSDALARAGFSWERLSGWLPGGMDTEAWEAVLPSMGVMALVRNLRNFDEAGVSDAVAEQVAAKVSDPQQVARSRMFPFRFWAAYKHTASLRWAHALEKALTASLANIPALPGRTLILVDRSPSMFPGYFFSTANKSDIPLADQAAVFGAAVALRADDPTLVEFGGQSKPVAVAKGGSVLRLIEQFTQIDGTDIPSAIQRHFAGHDRVIVITDEQTRPGYLPSNMRMHGGMPETAIDALVPANVPLYMWNFAGYKMGATASGSRNRHTFGGLTDQAFRLIPLLESGRDGVWPF